MRPGDLVDADGLIDSDRLRTKFPGRHRWWRLYRRWFVSHVLKISRARSVIAMRRRESEQRRFLSGEWPQTAFAREFIRTMKSQSVLYGPGGLMNR